MIRNYLRVAVRNIRNNKAYSLINVVGLAVGIASCILIILFVRNELGYDGFNKHADRIYRGVLEAFVNGHSIDMAITPAPFGPVSAADFPQVQAYTRISKLGEPVLRYGKEAFSEPRFIGADSTFFDVFTVHFLRGNPKTALSQPNSVVLTESMARKYFGDSDPMGKILNADHSRNWIVTGVIKDWPKNSHFQFDFLASLCTFQYSRSTYWLSNNYYTYLLLRKGTDAAALQKRMNEEFMKKYIGPQFRTTLGMSADQFLSGGVRWQYDLQPLTSIHLYSHLQYEFEPNGDASYVYVFFAIAVAILLIACVNFVNLSTARSEKRSKEVGIRKTLGSTRAQLLRQFLSESVLMSLLAVVLAIGLVEIFMPVFNDIAQKDMSLNLIGSMATIPLLVLLGIFVGLLAGSYPAFYLSSFRPSQVLKGDSRTKGRRAWLRGGLVVFQFVVSISLFIGTFVIYNQLKYIQNKNLGFDREQVIVIKRTDNLGNRTAQFKQELLSNPRVVSVSSSTAIPGDQKSDQAYWVEGTSASQARDIRNMWCDYGFLETYGITLENGRFFSKEHPSDSNAVVVNQEVEKAFGVKNLVGRNLVEPGRKVPDIRLDPVIGVVRNFNFQSLHQSIRPLAIRFIPLQYPARFISVRVKPGDYAATIAFLGKTWKQYAGDEAFDYNFLDQDLARLYVSDRRTSRIATIFSVLAIFVASLGLLGLAAFVTEQRTKEIGIRKVLGATVPEVVRLLSSDFVKWVLIANVLAWPIAYFVMRSWLQNFAYRIDIGIGVFVVAGILALVIALLTVSVHAVRAATANPVESLRYE